MLSKTGKVMMLDDRASSFQLLATPDRLYHHEAKKFLTQYDHEPTAVPVGGDTVAMVSIPTRPSSERSDYFGCFPRATAVNTETTIPSQDKPGVNPT